MTTSGQADGRDDAPDEPDGKARGETVGKTDEASDLEGRRVTLDAALAARRGPPAAGREDRKTGGGAGFGNALKMSSEFVAGVLVGAGIGYLIDRFAGTAPWGMIVFLLLGFAAGVLNVLRSAGVVAEPDAKTRSGGKPDDGNN